MVNLAAGIEEISLVKLHHDAEKDIILGEFDQEALKLS